MLLMFWNCLYCMYEAFPVKTRELFHKLSFIKYEFIYIRFSDPSGFSLQLCGLALFAETIWATTDPYYVYPVLGVTGKDDVFAGGWIGIFCGFSFFLLGLYGIVATIKGSRTMLIVVSSRLCSLAWPGLKREMWIITLHIFFFFPSPVSGADDDRLYIRMCFLHNVIYTPGLCKSWLQLIRLCGEGIGHTGT